MTVWTKKGSVEAWLFEAVPGIPNNPGLPVLLHRRAFAPAPPEAMARFIETTFTRNDWDCGWRYGVYPFHHFHSTAHEGLGAYRGRAEIQFGGPQGPIVSVVKGDVVIIPAGVGHACVTDNGLVLVGAYPRGQVNDEWRAGEGDLDVLTRNVADTLLPAKHPVTGEPMREWRTQLATSGSTD